MYTIPKYNNVYNFKNGIAKCETLPYLVHSLGILYNAERQVGRV